MICISAKSATAVGFLMLMVSCVHRPPELSKSEASRLISETREFMDSLDLVSVGTVDWASGPSQPDVALVRFRFRKRGIELSGVIDASAQFRYRDNGWHLIMFRYDDSGKATGAYFEDR